MSVLCQVALETCTKESGTWYLQFSSFLLVLPSKLFNQDMHFPCRVWIVLINGSGYVSSDVISIFSMLNYQRIRRESKLWRSLQHRNIVPFIGIASMPISRFPSLVSVWMVNGEDCRVTYSTLDADSFIRFNHGICCPASACESNRAGVRCISRSRVSSR